MSSIHWSFTAACVFLAGSALAKSSWDNPPMRLGPDVQHGAFHSPSLGTEVGYNICLPPQYSRNRDRHFPVIYYLHGFEGNESSYLEYARFWRDASARLSPVILVFVNGGERSFFCDAPDGSVPGETIVARELVSHIDQQYRTVANRAGRSLHGYSMGGFGALRLAFKFPHLFGSVVAYGATLTTADQFKRHLGKIYAQMFGNEPARFADADPIRLAERNVDKLRRRVAISLFIGTKDDFLSRNRALHEKLEKLMIPHSYREIRGASHNKDDLYEIAAAQAFQFSIEHFAGGDPR